MGKGCAATYKSDVRAVFSFKPSEMYLAPSAPMPLAWILRARANRTRQGALTVGERCVAAYSSRVRVLFALRPSEMCFAPSSPMLLRSKLRTGVKIKRQGALALGIGVCSDALDGG